jgi:hypothetical protein
LTRLFSCLLFVYSYFFPAGFLQGLSSLLQPNGQLVFMDSAASEFDIEVASELYKPVTLLTKSYHLGKFRFPSDIEVATELYKPATLLSKSYHLGKYRFLFDIKVALELYKPATLLTKSYHLGEYRYDFPSFPTPAQIPIPIRNIQTYSKEAQVKKISSLVLVRLKIIMQYTVL